MRNLKIIAALAILIVGGSVGWQIAACELANVELRDDMRDMASQLAGRIGLTSFSSDEDLRNDILHKAKKYDIQLSPEQVTVQRAGEGLESKIYLAADYTVAIRLPGLSFEVHFNPQSGKKPS